MILGIVHLWVLFSSVPNNIFNHVVCHLRDLIVFTLYTNSTDSLVSVLGGIWEKLGFNKHELTGVHADSEGHLNGFSGNIFSEAFAYSEEGFSDAYSKFSQTVTHEK